MIAKQRIAGRAQKKKKKEKKKAGLDVQLFSATRTYTLFCYTYPLLFCLLHVHSSGEKVSRTSNKFSANDLAVRWDFNEHSYLSIYESTYTLFMNLFFFVLGSSWFLSSLLIFISLFLIALPSIRLGCLPPPHGPPLAESSRWVETWKTCCARVRVNDLDVSILWFADSGVMNCKTMR